MIKLKTDYPGDHKTLASVFLTIIFPFHSCKIDFAKKVECHLKVSKHAHP